MLKRIISLLVLALYLHGMSGYAMNFHTCTITGFENIYTGFGLQDPCGEMKNDCRNPRPHFERGDCCDIQQTIVSIDVGSAISYFKTNISFPAIIYPLVQSYLLGNTISIRHFYEESYSMLPPEPCSICVFRI